MTIEDLQTICYQLPGVTESIKLWDHLCFDVGNKTFLYTYPDRVPPSASFKVPAEDFDELTAREGLQPNPYAARYNWIVATDINCLTKKEWEHYIRQSYDLILAKLPFKMKKGLGL